MSVLFDPISTALYAKQFAFPVVDLGSCLRQQWLRFTQLCLGGRERAADLRHQTGQRLQVSGGLVGNGAALLQVIALQALQPSSLGLQMGPVRHNLLQRAACSPGLKLPAQPDDRQLVGRPRQRR